jgi:2-methylisocitrate lyase-like PEP mutase family enzyme
MLDVNKPIVRDRATTRLKRLAESRQATLVPGAANAMFARVAEEAGFEAVYVTGAGVANMHLGAPDIGLTTVTEVAEVTAAVADAVSIPIIVDADTGFGNAVNVTRTVRLLERAGAAGIQLEDQVFPKKCGHFKGKDVIPLAEMLQKIHAATDTRIDPDLQIIARTDAYAIEGFEAALERGAAFVEAGADVVFVEAPTRLEEIARITQAISAPHLVNIVYGGVTPEIPREQLKAMGFSFVLYANAMLQAALKAAQDVMSALRDDGSLAAVRDRLASFEERQRVVDKTRFDRLEALYRVEAAS